MIGLYLHSFSLTAPYEESGKNYFKNFDLGLKLDSSLFAFYLFWLQIECQTSAPCVQKQLTKAFAKFS